MHLNKLLQQHEISIVTALILDIRDFVQMTWSSERVVGLNAVANFLETLFSISIQIAFENKGLVGEFAGDRLLITFGFPGPGDALCADLTTSVLQAVRTAYNIHKMVEGIKRNWNLPQVLRQFDIGIGLCAGGPAWIGDIGSQWRREFTIISTVVNIASRAEELTKNEKMMVPAPAKKIVVDQIIIEEIIKQVGIDNLSKYDLGEVEVRGLNRSIPLFQLAELDTSLFPSSPSIAPNDMALSTWICEYIEGAMERQVSSKVHQLLSDVGRIVTSVPNQEITLQQIMNKVIEMFAVETATLYLTDPNTDELIFECILSDSANPPKRGDRLPSGTGVVGWAVDNKKEVLIADVHQDKRWYGKIGYDIRSMLCVPLLLHKRVLGAIQIMDKVPGKFSLNDLNLMVAFAGSAAMAIENARLYNYASMSTQAQRDIAEALTSSLDLTVVLDTIMETLQKMLNVHTATLYMVDQNTGELIFENIISKSENPPKRGARLKTGTGIVGWVVENQEEVLISDVREDERWYGKIGSDVRSMLCVPLIVKERVVGVIQAMDESPGVFSEEDLNSLKWLAASAAVAVDNAAQFQALEEAKSELETAHRKFIASETMAGLGDITGKLTHTLTTKISAIQYFAQHMLPRQGGESVQETSQLILENAQMALAEIMKMREPLTEWNLQRVDVDQALAEVAEDFREGLESTSITEVNIIHKPATHSLPIFSGKGQIKYIFRNLLDNAIRAIEEKGKPQGTITIHADRQQMDGINWAIVQVEDSGIGIDVSDLKRVFELNYTTRPEGTVGGYGLFWVRLTVERLGGAIDLKSSLGKGATFTVCLPLMSDEVES